MSDNNSNNETNKYLFINLVTMLSLTAMQQLGKIINPVVGKADVNLEAAQATIDTLDMLFTKTGGNLDNDEARLLKDTLATLKLNYVETRDEEERKASQRSEVGDQQSAKTEGQKKNADKPEDSKAQGPADDKAKTKDPKFHKSYE